MLSHDRGAWLGVQCNRMSVAFRKIRRDLWKNKGRTLLVVMTIAVIPSLVASWLPARGATRISVRESLAYE